jgi:uncharacterized Zn-finger protein
MNEIMQYDESMLKEKNQENIQMLQELNHHIQTEMQKSAEMKAIQKKRKPKRTCCGCKMEFEGDSKLKDHGITVHGPDRADDPEKPHECTICFKRFTTELLLKEHNRTIFKKYKCLQCDKKFMTRANLNNHMKHHPEDLTSICCGCKKQFIEYEEYIEHIKEVHVPQRINVDVGRPFECEICYKRYPTRKSLVAHKRKALQHPCLECGEIFMKQSLLETHFKEAHTLMDFEKKICCGCKGMLAQS